MESQVCREFVERVAGRIRHSRMQGREERGDEDVSLDVVEEEDGYMADMKYGILAARYKGCLTKSTEEEVLKAVLKIFHLALVCGSQLCNVV